MIQATAPKSILYIDDHPVCHLGLQRFLRRLPSFELALRAPSCDLPAHGLHPDIVLLEMAATHPHGIAAIRHLKRRFPQAAILVLSSYEESIYADRCLKAGARGYLMKTASLDDLREALESIAEGELYVSEQVKRLMVNRLANPSADDPLSAFQHLSDRELLIVEQIALSKNNKEIAQALQISIKTIESHRSRIKAKLRLDSPQELMRFAMRMRSL